MEPNEILEKELAAYDAKREKYWEWYQDSGNTRYYNLWCKYDALVSAISGYMSNRTITFRCPRCGEEITV